MLVALASDKSRVKAAHYQSAHEIRKKFKAGSLRCPLCGEAVFPRQRNGFVLHFFHKSPCTSAMEYHPESPEHDQGKLQIARYLHRYELQNDQEGVKIEVEYQLPDCGENGRIADVAVVYDNENLLICECQLAAIKVDDLQKRTEDYWSMGADVLWFLGDKASTPENHAWQRSVFGASFEIKFEYTEAKMAIQSL